MAGLRESIIAQWLGGRRTLFPGTRQRGGHGGSRRGVERECVREYREEGGAKVRWGVHA